MFIILHTHNNFNTSRAKSDADALFKFRSFYFSLIHHIDFSHIHCECGCNDWSNHSYYRRYYTFLNRKIKVKILRIICNVCGKTHALLIEDMIPFSTLSFNQILDESGDSYTIDVSHHLFLFNKYKNTTVYADMCLMNARTFFLQFITT